MQHTLTDKITVLIDTREKRPLLFPDVLVVCTAATVRSRPRTFRVETQAKALSWGDYAIQGFETVTSVERKLCMDELTQNLLTPDRSRFLRALGRLLQNCKHPILYIERLPEPWWTAGCYGSTGESKRIAANTMDLLFEVVSRAPSLQLMWGGRVSATTRTRRMLGELVLRAMIQHILQGESA